MTMCTAAAVFALSNGSPVAAQGALDRLQVHGTLTQGFATSTELPIFGISTEGTAEYRSAALQFRYGMSENDAAVLQFRHRKLGNSLMTEHEGDVVVDWAFYQRRVGSGSVKVGRVPLPGGIFNETRNVGTLLPFFRASANYYVDGFEAMDGVVGTYELGVGSWSVEPTLAFGQVGVTIPWMTPEGPIVAELEMNRFASAQLWLNTPVDGVRVGATAQRWQPEDGQKTPTLLSASVDADRERYFVRGEYREIGVEGFRINSYYSQAGLRFGRLGVSGQADFMDMQLDTPMGELQFQAARDLAAGVSFAHTPGLVYKLEAHTAKGSNYDTYVDPFTKASTHYFIGSVSVSF
jgi:hypothetical protein